MNSISLRKALKQEFYCAAIAFTVVGLVQLDTCGATSKDEDVQIESFSDTFCSAENTPDAFCTQPH